MTVMDDIITAEMHIGVHELTISYVLTQHNETYYLWNRSTAVAEFLMARDVWRYPAILSFDRRGRR